MQGQSAQSSGARQAQEEPLQGRHQLREIQHHEEVADGRRLVEQVPRTRVGGAAQFAAFLLLLRGAALLEAGEQRTVLRRVWGPLQVRRLPLAEARPVQAVEETEGGREAQVESHCGPGERPKTDGPIFQTCSERVRKSVWPA